MEDQATVQDAGKATLEPTEEKPRRRRRGKKRTQFRVPSKMALPVRALWKHASEEDRRRAHVTCAAILEWWLGKSSKQEIAMRLELPPLRVWQLSQQALSGMLAGLLLQPRIRGRMPIMTDPNKPQDDPKALKKENLRLKEELYVAQKLIDILKELPENQGRVPPHLEAKLSSSKSIKSPQKASGGKKRRSTARSLDRSDGGSVDDGGREAGRSASGRSSAEPE